MRGYLLRRAGASLIVLLVASMLVFAGVRALPGDPALALAGEEHRPEGAARRSGRSTASTSRCRCSTSLAGPRRAWRPRHVDADRPGRRQHDRRPPAGHARARVPEPARGDRDRALARDARGGPARLGVRLSGQYRGPRRPVRAALLARPDADPGLLDRARRSCPRPGSSRSPRTRSTTCATCCCRRSCSAPASRR